MNNMFKKKYKHSIKRQIATIFVAIMLFTIGAMWLANNLLLEKFYTSNKEKSLISVYDSLCTGVEKKLVDTGAFELQMQRYVGQYNVSIVIISSIFDPVKIYANESLDDLLAELKSNIFNIGTINEILRQNDDYVIVKKPDTTTGFEFIEMWGTLPNGSFFMLRSAVDSIKESTAIANRFLLYISIGAVVLSAAVMFLCTFSDLKKANVELKLENDKKTQLDEMRKEFISNVSHELKTPIALIQGYAEGLKEEINDTSERDYYCDVIIDEASKMNSMVKKLLTLNRLEFGYNNVSMETFDIASLIRNYVSASDIILRQNNIEIKLPEDKTVFVYSDEYMIEEVLGNYISNAINHCTGEHKVIDVSIQEIDNNIKVSVFNTGNPIPPESLPHIWDKFYKVDKAHTREYGGSGVGLSIVKATMESLGQSYGAFNAQTGVVFWFTVAAADNKVSEVKNGRQ